MAEEVRVRIAPSPTGWFHIGTARTALFNYLFAKKAGGKFILRIEDTDKERNEEKYELDITQGLNSLGLIWDEGPYTEGPHGPYNQSKRLEIYNRYIKQLLEEEKAYKKEGAIYFKVPEKLEDGSDKIVFKDIIRGQVEFDLSTVEDFVIVKSDGIPIFHLAVVIDDFEMKISHVIRGEEHLSNTPKHILLQKTLNFPTPEYAHLPLIVNPDRTKMSKRKDPVSVTHDFLEKGYLPEALVNFIALLGWNPGDEREIFTLKDLESEFDLTRVQKSPAVFNIDKLNWLNGYWIRQLSLGELAQRIQPFLEKHNVRLSGNDLLKVVGLVYDRLRYLDEIYELTKFIFEEIDYEPSLLLSRTKDKEVVKQILEESLKIAQTESFEEEKLEAAFRSASQNLGIPTGVFFQTLRIALTGSTVSPPLFASMAVLGREKAIERLNLALKKLENA